MCEEEIGAEIDVGIGSEKVVVFCKSFDVPTSLLIRDSLSLQKRL